MWERGRTALLPAVLGVLLGASSAWGQGSPPGPEWQFEITPYLWLTSISGDVGVRGSPTVSFDTRFKDIIDDLDFGAMFSVEVHRGRWGFLLDSIYAKISKHGDTPGPGFSRVDIVSKSAIVEPAVFYTVWGGELAALDVFGGARIWVVDTELKFTGELLQGRKFGQTKAWADPVVGARLRGALWGKWFASLIGDVGGFGLNSDITWQAFAGVGYQISDTWLLKFGYRAIGVDYRSNGFSFDVIEYGPLLGLGIRF